MKFKVGDEVIYTGLGPNVFSWRRLHIGEILTVVDLVVGPLPYQVEVNSFPGLYALVAEESIRQWGPGLGQSSNPPVFTWGDSMEKYFSKAIEKPNRITCSHVFKEYFGLTDAYEYCLKCDLKRRLMVG